MQGKIRKLVRERGFGFIRTDDGQDVFFHRTDLQQLDFDHLEEGYSVEFELDMTPKGPRAVSVRRSSGQP